MTRAGVIPKESKEGCSRYIEKAAVLDRKCSLCCSAGSLRCIEWHSEVFSDSLQRSRVRTENYRKSL